MRGRKSSHRHSGSHEYRIGSAQPDWLSPDGNIAKTENHAPAGSETPKAHLGPETRKQEHQIKLAANRIRVRPGKNSVTHGLTLRVYRGLHEQRVRSGMAGLFQAGDRKRS